MSQNNGGPAFPVADLSKTQAPGMSLRDWFAGQALKGMLSSPPLTDRTKVDKDKWANIAFMWAEAMLRAREQHEA